MRRHAAAIIASSLVALGALPTASASPAELQAAAPADSTTSADGVQVPVAATRYFRSNSPPYPTAARRYGHEGRVVAQIVIDASGAASCTVATTSGSALLDAALVDWCAAAPPFEPARRNGKPEEFRFKIAYNFLMSSGDPRADCRESAGYFDALTGERGQLVEALTAIDEGQFAAAREEALAIASEHLRRLAVGLERSSGGEGWPVANATPAQVREWLERRLPDLKRSFNDAMDRVLAPGSAFYVGTLRQRRCLFDRLSTEELRAAVAFQGTPEGRAVLRSVQRSGAFMQDRSMAAVRAAGGETFDKFFSEMETTFPGFREALPMVFGLDTAE